MIYKHTHKPLFILLLILSVSNISFSQKLKIDTVYYNRSGQVVSQESDYLTYSIMQLDRRNRANGISNGYTKSGRITESTSYIKGEKTGTYYRYNPAGDVMFYGDYNKGVKTGYWVTLDPKGNILVMEKHDKNGVEIEKRLRPTVLIENASINDSLRIEVDAEFPGGHDGWGKHLRKNLKYPLDAKRYGYQGNVYMSFVVLSDGSITSAKIIGSPHEVLSAEALRMLEISPNWIPATVNGIPVDFQLSTLRVVFRLK